jgi:hypothetical protein
MGERYGHLKATERAAVIASSKVIEAPSGLRYGRCSASCALPARKAIAMDQCEGAE